MNANTGLVDSKRHGGAQLSGRVARHCTGFEMQVHEFQLNAEFLLVLFNSAEHLLTARIGNLRACSVPRYQRETDYVVTHRVPSKQRKQPTP